MSKSKTRKWYDKFDNDYDDYDEKRSKKDHRRKQRKLKNALRDRDMNYFEQEEDNY